MRQFEADIMPIIKERWSPRAFSERPVSTEDLNAVLEAARWAPSCFNEQPWRFVVADTPESLKPFHEALTPQNALWAVKAPVMVLICAHRQFSQSGKENRFHVFDSGTAWGFLSLEAQSRGLQTHAMAGYKKEQLREVLNIPEEWELMALITLGYYGDLISLDESLLVKEKMGVRQPLQRFIFDVFEDKKERI